MKKFALFVVMCVMIGLCTGCSSESLGIQCFYDILKEFVQNMQYGQKRVVFPWENGGKGVEEYSWTEFEALSPEQQEAFFDAFESVEAFEAWRIPAQAVVELPWEEGGKIVEEYTWTEFEALSPNQQEAFFDAFKSVEAFEAWRILAQAVIELPWENGGKAVNEYTWPEFEALSPEQQEVFFDAFESVEAFEAWRIQVQAVTELPWENGGKGVEEYSWTEFEALSPNQQEAFFDAFESVEAFEAWRIPAQTVIELPWEEGGKGVEEYSWEEFEALSPEQQEAFFDAFESVEAFEAWLNKTVK